MSKKSFIDSVKVGKPCSEDWEKMEGNDRFRFCSHCTKHVNNLSDMTRKEAMRFVRASDGSICIRYIPNPVTKRPLFADQLFQITRRAPRLAAGVMTASISLSALAYAQNPQPADPVTVVAEKQNAENETDRAGKDDKTDEKTGGVIRGTIRDHEGKPIAGVFVSLAGGSRSYGVEMFTDVDGNYAFEKLEPETYTLRVQTSSGVVRKVAPGLTIAAAETVVQDLSLRTNVRHVKPGYVTAVGSVGSSGYGGAYAAVEYSLPLSKAVADENIEEVQKLLDSGERVNGKDDNYDGITPLFIAVENGNVAIARLLIQYGAKVNAVDRSKRTPLMFIDGDATPELIEVLLQAGAKVNVRDKTGNSPLLVASQSSSVKVVKAMIDAGADLDAADKDGMTSLMKAAERDDAEIVDTLIIAGADINAQNKAGDTAWDKTSDLVIEKALVEAGARVNYDVEVDVEVVDEEMAPNLK